MSYREVMRYETEDGKLHNTEEDARRHLIIEGARKRYDSNRLSGNYAGSYVEFDDLMNWIHDNVYTVNAIINAKGKA